MLGHVPDHPVTLGVSMEDFATRAERVTRELDGLRSEAEQEAAAIVADLTRLRFRADQVSRVLRQLHLPIPDRLGVLLDEPAALAPAPKDEPVGQIEVPVTRKPEPEPVQHVTVGLGSRRSAVHPSSTGDTTTGSHGPGTYTTRHGEVRGVPTHPGIEAVPVYLRHVPAARAGGPIGQRIATAEFQKRILDDVLAHPTAISNEVAERLGMNNPAGRARVAIHMSALMRAGLIRRTGINRRVPGNNVGKASIEYAPPLLTGTAPVPHIDSGRAEVPPSQAAPAAAPTGATVSAGDPGRVDGDSRTDPLTAARDWVVTREPTEQFTAATLASAIRPRLVEPITGDGALLILEGFIRKGWVTEHVHPPRRPDSVRPVRQFSYVPPSGAGRAADLDHERAKASTGRRGRSNPVAGTGKKQWSTNSRTDAACHAAQKRWGKDSVVETGGGHIRVKPPGKPAIYVSKSPGVNNPAAELDRLRKAGLVF
jgi:hypothetical protein